MGRKLELLKEDSVNPQTASTKAERMIERDKVAAIVGEISSASCLTIAQVAAAHQEPVHQHRRQFRRAARQELQQVHVPRREPELDVREDLRPLADGAGPGQGQEVVLAHRRLRLRPRPAAGSPSASWKATAASSPPTSWCRPMRPTSRPAARNPQRQAGPRDLEPRRQPDHQLPQAVFGVRPRLPGRGLRLRHRARLGAPARTTSSAPGRWSGIT